MLMCRGLARLASDYIDDELTGSKKLSVKLHLMMCRPCRTFISNLRESSRLMSAHTGNAPDEAFIQRIDQRVTEVLSERNRNQRDG
jgi:predicted anti-sigma-YlaC factor YlaD